MQAPFPTPVTGRPVNPLLTAPILPTMIRLSLPNLAAMLASTLVAIIETIYVGRLGTPALAGMALVFPMVMLQQMFSAGAMGGGVSSAISRALGAGDELRARALAFHALLIAVIASVSFMALFLVFGPQVYASLGGRGDALNQALVYSNVFFTGLLGIWLTNTLASVIRGGGNMRVPSATLFTVAAGQAILGGGLGLGLWPFPRLGMVGVALGQVLAYGVGAVVLIWFMRSGRARVPLLLRGIPVRRDMFNDILKVGALAAFSPLQTVLTVLILTSLVARFGTESLAGYGIGARLEFLLVPITFAIGVACLPMVGMAVGASNAARARRVAWTGGAVSAVITGIVGLVVVAVPDVWATWFTSDPAVLESARSYLRWSGLGYGFFGLGLCLYFASQGAGQVLGPVLAGTSRLLVVAAGGWWLASISAPQWMMFALIGVAMTVYGLATAFAVYLTTWGSQARKG